MNQQLSTNAIIRQRGQLTIPDFIRQVTAWVAPGSVVSVARVNDDQIVIKPQTSSTNNLEKRWKETWEKIQLARSFTGKRGNLSKFVVEDRQKH